MGFRKTRILLFLAVSSSVILAQNKGEGRENDFGVSLGLTEYQGKEFILNNVRHSGMFPSFGLLYEIQKELALHKIEFHSSFNPLKSRYEKEEATFASNVAINYKYAHKVGNIDPHLSLFLGGVAGMDANIAYYENWDESHYYWLTSYYLGIYDNLKYQYTKDSFFSARIQLPLLAIISRPPDRFLNSEINPEFSAILSSIHDNLKLTSIHEHFDLKLELSYTFQYTSKFKQMLSWRFRYVDNQMSYSKRVNFLTHALEVTFLF